MSYVYLLEFAGSHKIGWSTDVKRRVRELTVPATIVMAVEGDRALESMLHRAFAPWCIGGEWFSLPGDKLELLIAWLHSTRRPRAGRVGPLIIRPLSHYAAEGGFTPEGEQHAANLWLEWMPEGRV